jgi:hypothetical protein
MVLDPFMGSGTTGVASSKAGRSFIGIEKDATSFDAAEKRIREAVAEAELDAEAARLPGGDSGKFHHFLSLVLSREESKRVVA